MEQWVLERNIELFERYMDVDFTDSDRLIVEKLLSEERRKLAALLEKTGGVPAPR